MPGTPTSLSYVSYPFSSPAKSNVAAETHITAAEAAQTRDTSTPPTGVTTKEAKINKESPLSPLPLVPLPPVLEDGDNLSLAYGLMLQSLPEEQLSAQVANLFGIALHFQQKIERLEKELQALEKRRLVSRRSVPKKLAASLPPAPDQPLPNIPERSNLEDTKPSAPPSATTDNTNVPEGSDAPITDLIRDTSIDIEKDDKTETTSNKSENEDRKCASLSEVLDQDTSQNVHEDLKAEIRRDLQASRSIFTALLSPTVISLIQSSFPAHRPCKSGREESKVVTSPVNLGYVPSIASTVQESKDVDTSLSSPGAGRSMLKSGTVSDQIVYPSTLRSNPILLSRGLKVVNSDSSTLKMASSPIALDNAISEAEVNDQEQQPPAETGPCVEPTAVIFGVDKSAKEEYPEQEANDKGISSSSFLLPPRPQRPEISADLDYLMTVFHSQLIAREQIWLENSGSGSGLEHMEEDPTKRDENKDLSGAQTTCLRTLPPTPQCPKQINPTPPTSSSSSSSAKDRSLVRKTPSPPNSSPSSTVSHGLAAPEMDQLQDRQLRLEQDVQHLMDVLTGHAHIEAQRSYLHKCHVGLCNHAHHHPRYYAGKGEYSHVEDENEQEHEQYSDRGTSLPPHIEELQHHVMHMPGYGQKNPQTPLLRVQEGTNTTEEVLAEILEGSGPAIETSVVSTITTTTAHTTVIEVPIWPSCSSGPSS
ncbi:hypothetical protein BGZ93_009252, partial [Podila epicladia]